MVDLKYHLLTIVAIFLALTIGLVIGMAIPGTEIFSEQQQTALADLETNFTRLKAQTSEQETQLLLLNDQLRAAEDLGRLAYPLLVKERLSGIKVGIIVSPIATTGLDLVHEALIMAGAEPAWELRLEQVEAASALVQTLTQLKRPNSSPTPEIAASTEDTLSPVDRVLLVGPFPSEFLPSLRAVKQSLSTVDIAGVGIQVQTDSDAKPFFVDISLSGVDNVDSPAGLISMIALLSGEQGHFGSHPSADCLLPELVSQWIDDVNEEIKEATLLKN